MIDLFIFLKDFACSYTKCVSIGACLLCPNWILFCTIIRKMKGTNEFSLDTYICLVVEVSCSLVPLKHFFFVIMSLSRSFKIFLHHFVTSTLSFRVDNWLPCDRRLPIWLLTDKYWEQGYVTLHRDIFPSVVMELHVNFIKIIFKLY